VNLSEFKPAWNFETEGMKQRGPDYTKPDGTPNNEAICRADFYDDLVVGADRIMSIGAIISSPVVAGNVVYVGSADGNL
jgi:outer membrane protein assembly factor BamB